MRRVLIFLAAFAPFATAAIDAPVQTEYGLVSGIPGSTPQMRIFKGIPYAAPPVGNLRWRAPQPAAKWEGVRKADEFHKACMQPDRPPDPLLRPPDGPMSEDCLYANIWTPAKAANAKLPVLLWIHGGGLRSGSSTMPNYNGEGMAEKGIVFVSINYRLGNLGFLSHPELTKESDRGASGNYGFLDMVAALKWIQKNIAAFGGDPMRVTICGQSGGGRAMGMLMASPLTKGLIAGVISQSGSALGQTPDLATAEQAGVRFARSKGANTLAELRALPARELVNDAPQQTAMPAPNIDGYLLPQDVYTIYSKGQQNQVPLLVGANADEGTPGDDKFTIQAFQDSGRKTYPEMADAFLKVYAPKTNAEARQMVKTVSADRVNGTMRAWARLHLKTSKAKAFLYQFTRNPPLPKDVRNQMGSSEQVSSGAYHGAELVYEFKTLKSRDWPWTDLDFKLSDTMATYWTNFIKTGDPNGAGLAKWPAYDEKSDMEMELGDKVAARPVPHKDGLDFFYTYLARPASEVKGGR